MSRAALLIKRNDKQTAGGNERFGVKHGDPVDVILDSEQPAPLEKFVSGDMNYKAFLVVEIDPVMVPVFRKYLQPTKGNKIKYRPRKKRLDIAKLQSKCGFPDLINRAKTGELLPLINGTSLTTDDFINASSLSNDIQNDDVQLITSGSYTIGSGGSYATRAAFFADFGSPFVGALTGTVISAITESSTPDMTEDINGNTLTITANSDPLGSPNGGHLATNAHNNSVFSIRNVGAGSIIIEKQNAIRTVAAAAAAIGLISYQGQSVDVTMIVRNCLFNNNQLAGCGVRVKDSNVILQLYNNMIWDCSSQNILIDAGSGNSNNVIANNSLFNAIAGQCINMGNTAGTIRNNGLFSSGQCAALVGSSDGFNNYASDATAEDGDFSTGSGNQPNQTMANGWKSVTDTDSNFLDIVEGGIFDGAGVTNVLSRTAGIRGRAVPGPKGTSVGAAEAAFRNMIIKSNKANLRRKLYGESC